MKNQINDNKTAILNKIGILDMMLESLSKIDKDQGEKVDELVKKISTRKLILMDELYTLLSPLS